MFNKNFIITLLFAAGAASPAGAVLLPLKGFTATVVSNTQVSLKWWVQGGASLDVTTLDLAAQPSQLERALDSSFTSPVAVGNGFAQSTTIRDINGDGIADLEFSFLDAGAVPGTTYFYRVRTYATLAPGQENQCVAPFTLVGSNCYSHYLTTTATPSLDKDGDGYTPPQDCNDNNPAAHPGVVELCNGIDDNCNGSVDEGCTPSGKPVSGNGPDGSGPPGLSPSGPSKGPPPGKGPN